MAVRRILRSVSVRARRRLADLSPAEQARARADREALLQRLPGLADMDEAVDRLDAVFGAYHADYCAGTGHPVHAASVELISFLLTLARVGNARQIVDLGSGLTSFALRRLALDIDEGGGEVLTALGGWDGPAPVVTSVDDSAEWLEKTRSYLSDRGVTTERLYVWDDFIAGEVRGRYDLVLHDMGFMDVRARTLMQAVGLARSGGVVVLDDMHKTDFRAGALKELETAGLETLSGKSFTRDELTRYAYLTFPA